MLNGLYCAAGALERATRNHEIVSENLAHVATPGYRRQGLIFDALADTIGNNAAGANGSNRGALDPQSFSHFVPGPLQQTNNPLDVAVVGDAFLVLDGPDGPLYTRNGAFELSPAGQLQARGTGYRVQGQGGAINLPTNGAQIAIGADGTISSNGNSLGRLQLATFDRPDLLRRVGTTLFQGDAPQTPNLDNVTVQQGFREGSNVQAVQEMVSMMLGMRYYEAAEKAMRAISESVAQNTRPNR